MDIDVSAEQSTRVFESYGTIFQTEFRIHYCLECKNKIIGNEVNNMHSNVGA